jgi:hypothetical protein
VLCGGGDKSDGVPSGNNAANSPAQASGNSRNSSAAFTLLENAQNADVRLSVFARIWTDEDPDDDQVDSGSGWDSGGQGYGFQVIVFRDHNVSVVGDIVEGSAVGPSTGATMSTTEPSIPGGWGATESNNWIAFFAQARDSNFTGQLPAADGSENDAFFEPLPETDTGRGSLGMSTGLNQTRDTVVVQATTSNTGKEWRTFIAAFETAAGTTTSAGTPVTITTSYAVKSGDTQTITTSYVVTSGDTQTLTTSYAVKTTGTQQTLTTSYDVTSSDTKTLTTSYAVQSEDTQTLSTSYAVKTTATPETITTSYAVKTTGTPQTITTSYDVAFGDTQTLTTSYAVESGNTQTLTTSYAVKTTGDAETVTTSYDVKLDGTETVTTSYAVTSEDSATITTSYAMAGTITPGSATLTTSYAVETSDTETVTTSYAVEVTGNTETLTTSYAVQLSPAGETITAAYAVVTSQGPSVPLNTSYKVSDTATPETVTTSYSVSIPTASPEVVVVKSLDMIPVGSVEQGNVETLTFEPEEDQSQFAGQQLILIVGGVGGTRAGGSVGSTFDTTFSYPDFNAYFDDEGSDQEVASEVFVVAHVSGGRWRGTLSWMGVRTITSSEPTSYSFTVNFDRDVGSNSSDAAGNIAGGILIRVNNVVDAFTGATKNWLLTATSQGASGGTTSQVALGSTDENFTGENNIALLFAGLDRIYSDAATGGASFSSFPSLATVELYDDGLEGTGAQNPTEQQSFAQAFVGYYLTGSESTRTTLFYNADQSRLPANNRRRNISLLEIPLSGGLPRPTTLVTSYSVALDNQETITTSYAVSTPGHVADDNLNTNYAVEAGNEKTVTASYAVKTTGTPETVTTSYGVEAPGTEKTLSTSYVVESGHEEEISTSYAITTNTDLPCSYGIKVDGLATVTASYGIKISDEQTVTTSYDVGFFENVAKITTSYAITGVTYAGTAAELHTKYAVINEAHLGYKAFRQLSTLRQKVK